MKAADCRKACNILEQPLYKVGAEYEVKNRGNTGALHVEDEYHGETGVAEHGEPAKQELAEHLHNEITAENYAADRVEHNAEHNEYDQVCEGENGGLYIFRHNYFPARNTNAYCNLHGLGSEIVRVNADELYEAEDWGQEGAEALDQ